MWTYEQSTGHLLQNGRLVATGYAGIADGYNSPSHQNVRDIGPIPVGEWLIDRFFDSAQFGPIVAHLWPKPGTETFSRSGFLIHGDSKAHPGLASHGCIVLSNVARIAIRDSKDTALMVIAGQEK